MMHYVVIGSVATEEGLAISKARIRAYRVPPLPSDQSDGPIKRGNPTFVEAASGPDGYFVLRDTWQGGQSWEYILEVHCNGYSEHRTRLTTMPSGPIHVVLHATNSG